MKRLLVTLFCVIIICNYTLQAQEIRQFIDTYYGFTLYEDNTIASYCPSYYKQQIDGNEYHKSQDGRYGYRQDGDKIYCYTIAEEKEMLVMDFGLKVGDIFALYDGLNVTVEEVSDTILPYSRNQQVSCKRILLRGVEQPNFTDTWIEDIGSLRYGLNPPKAGDTRLIYTCRYVLDYYRDKYEYQFDFCIGDVHGVYVSLGKSVDENTFNNEKEYLDACENKFLTFDLRNDTLCIEGYIAAWCDRKPYFLIEEGIQDIFITSTKYYVGYQQDCTSVYPIDIKIPGFAQDKYTVHYDHRFYQIPQNGLSTLDPIDIEGKAWRIMTQISGGAEEDYLNGRYTKTVRMWIEGDTIVDGTTCKRLYTLTKEMWNEGRETLEVGYCRQDGEKYYQNGEPMFDFSLQAGDVFVPEKGMPLTVKTVGDTILADGVVRKYLLMVEDPNGDITPYNSDWWIEGLGSLRMGIYSNDFSSGGQVRVLQSYSYGEKIIYSREILPFVDKYRGFMLYENGKYSYYTLYGECTIDGVDYIKEGEGRYAYRQDGDKVYCYSFAGGKEYLVMDFGLEVGDIFTLYEGFDVVVEQKSDTLLACWNAQMTCKKLQLRGVEQPDFTDTWIEGIGSLRYGINPPKPKNTYLLHSSLYMEECKDYCDYCTFVFDPQEENLYATIVTLGEEIYEDAFSDYNEYMEVFYENKLLTLDLRDDTLYIGGYIGTYCERSLYFLIDEGVGTIYITSVPFPLGPEADCRSVNAIDVRIPGFTQKEYTIYCMGKEVVVRQPDDSYLVTEGKQWAVCRYSYSGGFRTETYHLQGDTIINGKTYKIEHASRNEDLSDMKPSGRYMREEDGRVYSITNKDQRDDFVFDYSMEIGDTLFYNPHTDYYGNVYKHPVCLRLIAIRDTIMPNGDGRVRKCYDTEEGCLNGDDVYEFHPVFHSFIEDIGYTATGLSSSEIGTTGVGYSLLYVKQGDTMLYQQEDGVLWKDNTNIEDIKANSPDTPYYDLQGRPVAHPTRGIYIKDGKKVAIK